MESHFTEHELFQSFLRDANIKFFWKDTERRFLGASKSFLDYYGFTSLSDILGKTDEDMGWHIDPEPYKNDEYQVLQTGKPVFDSEGSCIIKGQVHHILATKIPVRTENGKIAGLVGYFIDVTESQKNTELLLFKANNDSLTGLANRNGLMDAADAYVAEYEKNKTDFIILFIDINHFKSINETYGHTIGDQYLKSVAKDLLDIAGSTSVIARYGGDTFVILRQLPVKSTHSVLNNTVLSMVEHIQLKQQEAHLIDEHFLRLDIAIGWCAYSETENLNEALKLADKRMYEEKAPY